MYSTAKRLSVICAISCAISIMGILLLFAGYPAFATELNVDNFPLELGAMLFMGASALINLLLTLALRNMCQALEYELEGQAKKFNDLSKKIKDIETKM